MDLYNPGTIITVGNHGNMTPGYHGYQARGLLRGIQTWIYNPGTYIITVGNHGNMTPVTMVTRRGVY